VRGNRYNNQFCLNYLEPNILIRIHSNRNFFFGEPMSLRRVLRQRVLGQRVLGLAATALATLLWVSCGQVYRPVVLPINTVPPSPANFHAVFGLSTNGTANPGTALQIDVAGDSNIGSANMGENPTYMAILPSNSRVFVTSAGSLIAGDADKVTSFTPAADTPIASGLGNPVVFSLPSGSLPDFVTTTSNTSVYVANYGSNSVSSLSTVNNAVTLTQGVGTNPIAMAETPNGLNLYVINQGDNTITDLYPVDLSTIATFPVANSPVWEVIREDSQRLYVLTQGSSTVPSLLHTFQTSNNAEILPAQPVGVAGANFVLYDKTLNRLYVTNPTAMSVYVFDASVDPPSPLPAISMTAGATPPCPGPCSPVSVTALPDGTRFYVASYEDATSCPDPNLGPSSECIVPLVTVFDASTLSVIPATVTLLPPSITLLSSPPYAATQYAVPKVPSCTPLPAYAPGSTRFRMFTTSSEDSSHVYASICDAGEIADIDTSSESNNISSVNTPDMLITDIEPPLATCTGTSCGSVATVTGYSIASNIVTFQAVNSFYIGEQVEISNLTTATGQLLNDLTFAVLSTGLSGTQFSGYLPPNFSVTSQGFTSDTGTAVPLPPTQSPIFLLTGQ
jgi:YVTN family beta-propeller protein